MCPLSSLSLGPPCPADMRLKTPSAEDFHCSLQELLERGEPPLKGWLLPAWSRAWAVPGFCCSTVLRPSCRSTVEVNLLLLPRTIFRVGTWVLGDAYSHSVPSTQRPQHLQASSAE